MIPTQKFPLRTNYKMTIEGEVQQSEEFVHKEQYEIKPSNESDQTHLTLAIQMETIRTAEYDQKQQELSSDNSYTEKKKRVGRFALFLGIIVVLFAGQFSVPDNEVSCVQDKVMEALGFANRFINTPGNENYRDFFQAFCSFLLDIIFILTLGYWVLYGKSARLPMSLGVFYVTRAIVQTFWMSPFPEGNYWYSPGFPSLVVPYGRQSDFFFSGHSGFLVICASEWHKLKMPKLRNFVIATTVYTILILMIYRTHYSIDIFTGVIFAEWCFCKVDAYKEVIGDYWVQFVNFLKSLIGLKGVEMPFTDEKGSATIQV